MTIIEALELGMPILARRIASLAAESEGMILVNDPAEAAASLQDLAAHWPNQERVTASPSIAIRRQILSEAYGLS